jgi:GGDEF domain-containing protein
MESDKPEIMPISREEFQSLALFQKVSFESLAGYLLNCKVVTAVPHEVLISPLMERRRLMILIEGLLEVRMNGPEGLFLDDVVPGTCVGEMSVFDNADPSAWVIAKKPSRLLEIESSIALAMLNASHDLCLNLLHILSQRVRYSNKIVFADQHHIRCIEENAMVDSLTGLHNRRWLESMYTREMHRSNSGNFLLAAFMIDIDHFKNINDTYGHLAGDQVLISVARALVQCLRPSDMAERIRRAVENTSISLQDGSIISVTVSVGYAARTKGDTVKTLLDKADQGLYCAKKSGRNHTCCYTEKAECL